MLKQYQANIKITNQHQNLEKALEIRQNAE